MKTSKYFVRSAKPNNAVRLQCSRTAASEREGSTATDRQCSAYWMVCWRVAYGLEAGDEQAVDR